jgi:caffeoyl-CoA O-methyltransferase
MNKILAEPIEAYLASLQPPPDPLLEDVAEEGRKNGIPVLDAASAAVLSVLAAAIRPRRILEIGTGSGYSGICLARHLPPDGMLLTVEIDPRRASDARAVFARAGVADRANVMVGHAVRLATKVAGPFDIIFQDGDKTAYKPLHGRLVSLLRPGGLLIVDNVLWGGEVAPGFTGTPARSAEPREAIVEYNRVLAGDTALTTVFLPVGDGLAVAVKR